MREETKKALDYVIKNNSINEGTKYYILKSIIAYETNENFNTILNNFKNKLENYLKPISTKKLDKNL